MMSKRLTAIILAFVLLFGLTAMVGAATLDNCADNVCPLASSYVGNARTYKFHFSGCRYVGQMNAGNKVYFDSRDEAVNAGYVPCKVCRP
ncbi:hypothetical protein KIAC18_000327 [Sporomusa sphaeroides]|uniref:Ada metal-binding domain-containing protein n=1 Tax=Sporomusa sphaeroides TaxID=47679 RepID=UPI003DA0610C